MAISLDNVGKSFTDGADIRWVIRNLSLTVDQGEFVVVWGPSGSGKTTILNLIAGLIQPDEGSISYIDKTTSIDLTIATMKERLVFRRQHIGYVYQFFNLIPTLNVRENIELPLELNQIDHLDTERVSKLLEDFGLAPLERNFPHTLSGGEQQRVAIARAIVHQPNLVLADEPTGNLDSDNASLVLNQLLTSTKTKDCSLIVATHDDAFRRHVDRVIEL